MLFLTKFEPGPPQSHFDTHSSEHPPKVRHTSWNPSLKNPSDCPASIYRPTLELCKQRSIKLQLYCILLKKIVKNINN